MLACVIQGWGVWFKVIMVAMVPNVLQLENTRISWRVRPKVNGTGVLTARR